MPLCSFKDGTRDISSAVRRRTASDVVIAGGKKRAPSYLQVFFYEEKQTPHLFLRLVIFLAPSLAPLPAPPHLQYLSVSLSLSSGSTSSANSCLSAAQKCLCLADVIDKRLNACCPHGGRGWKNREREMGKLRKDENNNYSFKTIN